MTRFKAAYVSGPVAVKDPAGASLSCVHGPSSSSSARRTSSWCLPDGGLRGELPPPGAVQADTLLDVVVAQLAGRGPAAHQIWLPPLYEPPTLD